MQEDFLHYLWQHKKFDVLNLRTTEDEIVDILSVGQLNMNSGPDFFNAKLRIGGQLWAGNVEIHIKSSDWYLHRHELDKAYDNVILHNVWEDDVVVLRKNNTNIPTVILQEFITPNMLDAYYKLFNKKNKWINCEQDLGIIDSFIKNNWLERLFYERLEHKSKAIEEILKSSKNDWEAVLFKLIAKNFGLKVNGDAFYSLANSFEYSIIRKSRSKILRLEALLFGQAGLLEHDFQSSYFANLKLEYEFLKQKFKLSNREVIPSQFFRLRPSNFPTIRISQLAGLYHKESNLLSQLLSARSIADIYELLNVKVSSFWKSHYTFDKTSASSNKVLTKSFIDLLIINTIIPFRFTYEKHHSSSNSEFIAMMDFIKPEKNGIIEKFAEIGIEAKSATDSQALLQLKSNYCDKNRCLKCAIGSHLLNKTIDT